MRLICAVMLCAACVFTWRSGASVANGFVNFETAPVHPIALSPDGNTLVACNGPDARIEVFDVSLGTLVVAGSVPVGLDPVSVRFRSNSEVWVANTISDSISVVDVPTLRVKATVDTLQSPADIVFAGTPVRAFVSCAMANTIQVFDPESRQLITNIVVQAERPKALAVSPDGQKVYVAIFESGNGTTIVGANFRNLTYFSNAVSAAFGPYGGVNPPPNNGNAFMPPFNEVLGTNVAPATGIIVRKNAMGRWLDDNARDWTEFVSGTNAGLTQRVAGWDLPDRDLAVINTSTLEVEYATGLMNICMGVGVNPVSGKIAVVGTDALNEVRFEPNLNGVFARVRVALVDATDLSKSVSDLNPHLNYAARSLPAAERDQSIGEPRAIAWRSDGARAYVAGMGSRNVVVIDGAGNRVEGKPIETGEGPCGLALDESRNRLYVFNRFSSSISVINTANDTVEAVRQLFDPTPIGVAIGRRHLYDTRRTSGLGHVACATCHVDARMDRLGWDLGNPAGETTRMTVNHQGTRATNDFHPMKGVMVTQTLQDIIGHEPFHWRGDKESIEAFASTFTNLQAAAQAISSNEMRELREFLGSIHFPPNRLRNFDNSLSTNVPLAGQVALGEHVLPNGTPLPNGNALAGLATFNAAANFCGTCHTLPTGLGLDAYTPQSGLQPIPVGANGEHHFPLAFRLEGSLRSKIAHFRNMAEKVGMDGTQTESRAGFGFGHDGSIDSLTRFLNGVRVMPDQDVANLTAFLLSVPGADVGTPGAPLDGTPPASVGRQLTVTSAVRPALFDAMIALGRSPTSRVELIAKGVWQGSQRGWFFDRARDVFQSDRAGEAFSSETLLGAAGPGAEITLTIVPRGTGVRLGIDRDFDGMLDRDEIEAGGSPASLTWAPRIVTSFTNVPTGLDHRLDAQVPPLPAPGSIAWMKDGVALSGATNGTLLLSHFTQSAAGEYQIVVSTAFQSWTSAPVRLAAVPLLVTATPELQFVRRSSNAVFSANVTGADPVQYRWFFNGQPLQYTNASLVVTNVGLGNEGSYSVVAMNAFGSSTSAPVHLTVLVNPAAVVSPLSQSVPVGGTATFSFVISGNPAPFGYQLRRSSTVILTNYTSAEPMGFFTLANVQSADAGTYRVVVTNMANPAPGLTLGPVTLAVLADSDGDSMADDWEVAHELDLFNAADGGEDSDGDGQTNAEEYRAGTNPRDAQSALKVELRMAGGQSANVISFSAASNTTYTVEQTTGVGVPWMKLIDVVGFPTNRSVSVTNLIEGVERRFYRVVTPRKAE